MGAGHDRAAAELGRRLSAAGHDFEIVDFLHLLPWRLGDLLRLTYEFQLRRCPWTYEAGYRLLGSASTALWRFNVLLCGVLTNRSVRRVLSRAQPDVVVSTYPFASLVLGQLRRSGKLRVPVATYLTDFAVHPLWVHAGVDLHLAVSEDSARAAQRRGALTAVGTGPLVGESFRRRRRSPAEVRHALGISEEDRVALVVAGSLGFGAVREMVRGIRACGDYHVIAVCGTNAKLQTTLLQLGVCGTILGWTDDMPDLMGASDVLVENAGGLTAMEAFAVGLPVVTYRPIAGHGRDNARTMNRAQVSLYPRSLDELARALDEVTKAGARREALVAAGAALFADDPARCILELADAGVAYPAADAAPRRSARVMLATGWRSPARVPTRVRAVAFTLVALLGIYGALTEGAETVAALGVGVIKPPAGVRGTVYLGVRLTPSELRDMAVLRAIRDLHATAVVDGRSALTSGRQLQLLVGMHVDLANGGWGAHSMLPWTRAKHDCQEAGRVIAQRARVKPDEFVPGRELDAFDQLLCRTGGGRARLVLPNRTFGTDHLPESVQSARIYLLDGRRGDPRTLETALASFRSRVDGAGLHVRSLRDLH
jgi:UDP-N-acetylglucosamine:LPS N-acetylglucosamine transferase